MHTFSQKKTGNENVNGNQSSSGRNKASASEKEQKYIYSSLVALTLNHNTQCISVLCFINALAQSTVRTRMNHFQNVDIVKLRTSEPDHLLAARHSQTEVKRINTHTHTTHVHTLTNTKPFNRTPTTPQFSFVRYHCLDCVFSVSFHSPASLCLDSFDCLLLLLQITSNNYSRVASFR